MPGNFRLFLDLLVLPFYILWVICLGRFMVHTPVEEVPHRQPEMIFYSVWFLALLYHAAVCYRDDRIALLLDFFRRLKHALRDYVLQGVVGTFLWDFLRFIHLPTVCIMTNAFFELCFVILTCLAGTAVFHYSICNLDETFYSHNLFFLIMYGALRVRCRDLYDVGKLVGHFAYAALHLGCVGDHLGYPGSYYAINLGLVVFTLLIVWTWLSDEPLHDVTGGGGVGSSGDAPSPSPPDDEARPGYGPSSDDAPDDTELSPRGSQWKPKSQKKKKKR